MIPVTDLTKRPPRSPRTRLGGYVILPRLLDKCRAELTGTHGEYHFNCPLDQRFFAFAGVSADALREQVALGLGDGALLAWIQQHSSTPRADWEIAQWSAVRETAVPADNEMRDYVSKIVANAGGAAREDVGTWFEILDLDDYASFGGTV